MRGLERRRRLARWAMLFETAWPAAWPVLAVLGAFVVAALLELPQRLPPAWHAALLAIFILAAIALVWRGRKIRWPAPAEADRRLERDSGLRHRPLAVLSDTPAQSNDPVWAAHVARARAQVGRLRVALPRPGLARRDPRALRAALLLGLAVALVLAGPHAPGRLAAALWPRLNAMPAAAPAQVQAWITPPGYTGVAPVILSGERPSASVPAGSRLTVSVTGGSGEPALTLDAEGTPFTRLDGQSWQAQRDLPHGGALRLSRAGAALGAWTLAVVPDQPPTASWTEPPSAGERTQTRLPWGVADDYGVVSLQAELRLRDLPEAARVVVPIPLTGGVTRGAQGVQSADLSAHPWAGLPVMARLIARDQPGQTGISDAVGFVLPERLFRHPAARALVVARRMLVLHPEDRRGAVAVLNDVIADPSLLGEDAQTALELGAVAGLLAYAKDPAAIAEAQQELWSLALRYEDERPARTARALDRAREAAKAAMERARKDASEQNRAELDQKLQALDQAAKRHMQALNDEARRDGSEMPPDARLDPNALDRETDEAREAAREGRMDEAGQKLAELDKMLDKLRSQQTPRQQAQGEKRKRGKSQMSAVQDMIAREGRLADSAQARANPSGRTGLNRDTPNDPKAREQGEQTDAKVQQALRRALGELMQQSGDLTGDVPQGLSQADLAMRGAHDALQRGQDGIAGTQQQQAIAALQKGAQELNKQLAQQLGKSWRQGQDPGAGDDAEDDGDDPGQGNSMASGEGEGDGSDPGDGTGEGGDQPGRRREAHGRRDPLGREVGEGTGAEEGGGVRVPDTMERQRAQDIQQELRRRGGERTRPASELDYIDRLLRQF